MGGGQNHTEILELLLENGAPVDDQQPLIEAVRRRKSDLAKLLIEYGTDLTMKNWHDLYALLATALQSKDAKLFAKVVAASASNYDLEVLPAVTRANTGNHQEFVDIIDALLEQGADINAPDGSGHTALYYAIKNRAMPLVS